MKYKNDFELPTIISDGMLLQRNAKVNLWGYATPEKEITIDFLDQKYTTLSDDKGRWQVTLSDLKAGGPFEMMIECEEKTTIIKDIVIGDVWVLGGQSNMEFPMKSTIDLFEEELRTAQNPYIRQFTVPLNYNFNEPQEEVQGGKWEKVTPASIGNFSAAGYFFAKEIYNKHQVPIGLILTATGGSPAEAWMSQKSIQSFDRFHEIYNLCRDSSYVNETKKKDEQINTQWYQDLHKKDEGFHTVPNWYEEDYEDKDWSTINIPNSFMETDLETFRGSIWLRKEINVTETMLRGKGKLYLGMLIESDDTYINGIKVGSTGYQFPLRRYEIPEGVLKKGKNVISIRLVTSMSIGGFMTDMKYRLIANGEEIDLIGTWKYKIGGAMEAKAATTAFQYKPVGLFNGMIYPLRKYSIKGVLWYQGEGNTKNPDDYKEIFEAVIKDWRNTWSMGEFPFIYTQIANYAPFRIESRESGWAKVRDEQRKALEILNTGMAVIIDGAEYNDLHPQNKKVVGERLSLWARKLVYGDDVVCSGPIYDRKEIVGDKVYIYFTHNGSGLIVKGEELKQFALSGEDGNYVEAKAWIEDNKVVVFSEKVTKPVSVRYAWADDPKGANLYNKEGLPASPFGA